MRRGGSRGWTSSSSSSSYTGGGGGGSSSSSSGSTAERGIAGAGRTGRTSHRITSGRRGVGAGVGAGTGGRARPASAHVSRRVGGGGGGGGGGGLTGGSLSAAAAQAAAQAVAAAAATAIGTAGGGGLDVSSSNVGGAGGAPQMNVMGRNAFGSKPPTHRRHHSRGSSSNHARKAEAGWGGSSMSRSGGSRSTASLRRQRPASAGVARPRIGGPPLQPHASNWLDASRNKRMSGERKAAAGVAFTASSSASYDNGASGSGGGAAGQSSVVAPRSAAERAANPERLNLDRRGLTSCPMLDDESQLRLLNFENNSISKITNMHKLQSLIFLDLYNNQVEEISGLEHLKGLRVLMLGKNNIQAIQGLEHNLRLDVLDLHSNQISVIENLSHLAHLRVLNLAGNAIESVNGLDQLTALTELNLRRNKISRVTGLSNLKVLQRVFLSNNLISSFSDLDDLFDVPSLQELSLDGNAMAKSNNYRDFVIDRIRSLRHLDLRRISEKERSAARGSAAAYGSAARPSDSAQESPGSASASSAAVAAATLDGHGHMRTDSSGTTGSWGNGEGNDTNDLVSAAVAEAAAAASATGNNAKNAANSSNSPNKKRYDRSGADITSQREVAVQSVERAWAKLRKLSSDTGFNSGGGGGGNKSAIQGVEREDAAAAALRRHAFFEINDANDGLVFYGPAFEGLSFDPRIHKDKDKFNASLSLVRSITFRFVEFEDICQQLPKIRKFHRLSSIDLQHCNVQYLYQLQALSVFSLDRLSIGHHNPVCHCPLLRLFVRFCMPTLKELNNVPFSAAEIDLASRRFGPLKLQQDQLLRSALKSKGFAPQVLDETKQGSAIVGATSLEGKDRRSGGAGGGAGAGAGAGDELDVLSGVLGTPQSVVMYKTAVPQYLTSAPSRKRKEARRFMEDVFRDSLEANEKLQKLDQVWPRIIQRIIQSTLHSSHMHA